MQDGTKYQGRVEHLDPVADLATIRINAVRTRASLVIYAVTITKICCLITERSAGITSRRLGRRATGRVRDCDWKSAQAEQHGDCRHRQHCEESEWRAWNSRQEHRLHPDGRLDYRTC